jgi:cyclophilin family peptidyl-prolyl cis-trans isomerase
MANSDPNTIGCQFFIQARNRPIRPGSIPFVDQEHISISRLKSNVACAKAIGAAGTALTPGRLAH